MICLKNIKRQLENVESDYLVESVKELELQEPLSKPQVLILDEATSALDNNTEELVMKKLIKSETIKLL